MKKPLNLRLHRLALAFAAAILLLAAATRAGADTPAVTIPAHVFNSVGNPTTTFGWAFTLANPVIVTQLGFRPENIDGPTGQPYSSTQAIPIGIWDSAGILLCMATLPAGAPGVMFDYVPLTTPTLLAPGSYTIGGYTAFDTDFAAVMVDSITPAAGVTYNGGRSVVGTGLSYPAGDDLGVFFGASGYFGPNFQFIGIPEPSTWTMMLGGLAMLGVVRRLLR